MKVGLILPNNIWFCPFVNIYIKILKEHNIEYDIISWNRDGRDPKIGFQYEKSTKMSSGFNKLVEYLKYSNYVKSVLKTNDFDRLIVFCPQVGIFLSNYLKKKYKNRYIFDFRDLSIEQKSIFKRLFRQLLTYSFANIISSPGFLKKLPSDFNYILSHNFDIELVKKALQTPPTPIENIREINVLTIGGIRDYLSNSEVISSLSNKLDVKLNFVGRGHAAQKLQDFAKSINCNNIHFEGYYPKEDEETYIKNCSFLNIFYPKIISHSTALSNRFYNALIYKRPMIVTSQSIQGDFVEKYQLGIVVDNCDSLDIKLQGFIKGLNFEDFSTRCNSLLRVFEKDYITFEKNIKDFLQIK